MPHDPREEHDKALRAALARGEPAMRVERDRQERLAPKHRDPANVLRVAAATLDEDAGTADVLAGSPGATSERPRLKESASRLRRAAEHLRARASTLNVPREGIVRPSPGEQRERAIQALQEARLEAPGSTARELEEFMDEIEEDLS